jgi:hypothetical protein
LRYLVNPKESIKPETIITVDKRQNLNRRSVPDSKIKPPQIKERNSKRKLE